jgi:hypothetical protein
MKSDDSFCFAVPGNDSGASLFQAYVGTRTGDGQGRSWRSRTFRVRHRNSIMKEYHATAEAALVEQFAIKTNVAG